MRRLLIYVIILFPVIVSGQDKTLGYKLDPGKRYSLKISVNQSTFSDTYDQSSDVTLDLRMTLHFDIQRQINDQYYTANVSYDELYLSMLAPSMNIDINSGSGKNLILSNLIDTLESRIFRLQLKRDGSFILFSDINACFFEMYDFNIGTEEERDVIIKTLREAFGNNAFNSICNIFVNLYPPDYQTANWDKSISYYFNTKPVAMTNRFFLVKQTIEQNTIQGIGMISPSESVTETNDGTTVSSSASGSQTYDLQADPESGWLHEGTSRQRIMVKTTIVRDNILPRGLEIPSYTETLFTLKGTSGK